MEIISSNSASNHLRRMPQSPLFQICSYPNSKVDWHRSVIGEVAQLTLWWLRMRVIKKWFFQHPVSPSVFCCASTLHEVAVIQQMSNLHWMDVQYPGCQHQTKQQNLDLTMAPGWVDSVLLSCFKPGTVLTKTDGWERRKSLLMVILPFSSQPAQRMEGSSDRSVSQNLWICATYHFAPSHIENYAKHPFFVKLSMKKTIHPYFISLENI